VLSLLIYNLLETIYIYDTPNLRKRRRGRRRRKKKKDELGNVTIKDNLIFSSMN